MDESRPAMVYRKDGADLRIGQFVVYGIQGIQFGITASRYGVEVRGSLPPMSEQGVRSIQSLLHRALMHHTHLASFQIGEAQTILDEDTIEKRLNPTDPNSEDSDASTRPHHPLQLVPKLLQ